MGWENRHGNSYYYRKEREGLCTSSVYVGAAKRVNNLRTLDALTA